jgi:hypothetical protein
MAKKAKAKKRRHKGGPRASSTGPQLRWAAFTIGAGGVMNPDPLPTIPANTGDWVVWVVTNATSKRLTIKLKDFHKKHAGTAVTPIDWFDADNIAIAPGATSAFGGTMVYWPDEPYLAVKYTVGVTGPATHDYDPDLEVSPPN